MATRESRSPRWRIMRGAQRLAVVETATWQQAVDAYVLEMGYVGVITDHPDVLAGRADAALKGGDDEGKIILIRVEKI